MYFDHLLSEVLLTIDHFQEVLRGFKECACCKARFNKALRLLIELKTSGTSEPHLMKCEELLRELFELYARISSRFFLIY